jgi:hypothetical protein
VDRTQIHVIGREIPQACIWTAYGIASCYATTQTAVSISVPSQTQHSTLLQPLWHLTQLPALLQTSHTVRSTDFLKHWQQHDRYPDAGMVILACPKQQPIIPLLQILTLGTHVQFSRNTRLCGRLDRHDQSHPPPAKLSKVIGQLQKNISSVRHPATGGHYLDKFTRLRNF